MAVIQSVCVYRMCVHVRKLSCMTNVRVLCLSLRQRGNRGWQCRGEGERSLPAHYRQSADSFRIVTQTGATRLNTHTTHTHPCPHRHIHTKTQRSGNACTQSAWDMEDALFSKMSHTHTYTVTKSHDQQWCQVDNRVPCVLTQSCTLPVLQRLYDTEHVLIKEIKFIHALWTVCRKRFCTARWRFAKLRPRVEDAVISLYSICWTEYVFVLVLSFWLFISLFSRWNVPFYQGLDSLFIISVFKHKTDCRGVSFV